MCSDQVCGAVVGQIEERVAGIQRCLTWWRNTRVWIMSRVIWAWGRIGRGDGLGDTMNDSVARHVGWLVGWTRASLLASEHEIDPEVQVLADELALEGLSVVRDEGVWVPSAPLRQRHVLHLGR